MSDNLIIHVCCNSAENGMFIGVADALHIGDCELDQSSPGRIGFSVGDGFIKLSRRKFLVTESQEWVGNWCWNAYKLSSQTELDSFKDYVKSLGKFSCVGGRADEFDWWNSSGV